MTTGDYLKAIKETFERKMDNAHPMRDDEVIAYALVVIAQELRNRGV